MKRRSFVVGSTTLAAGAAVATGWKMFGDNKTTKENVQLLTLTDLPVETSFDVCVIGSGPAGSIISESLSSKGLSVAMFESGTALFDTEGMQNAIKLDAYENSGGINYPIQESRFRAIGGTSNIWTGRCPRLLPSDFVGNPLGPKEGWPISYAGLKSHYQKAEELLRVSGDQLTASHAPREIPLPLRANKDISALKDLLKPINIQVDSPPTSLDRTVKGPVRFTSERLQKQSKVNRFSFYSGATAQRIEVNTNGIVTGVYFKSFENVSRVARAKMYIIACGALESTRLLLLSKNELHPGGLGNQSDHLGRYFMEHPFVGYSAKLPNNQSISHWLLGRTYQFAHEANKAGLGKVLLAFYGQREERLKISLGIEMIPNRENRITLSEKQKDVFNNAGLNLKFDYSEADIRLLKYGEALVERIFSQLGCIEIQKRNVNHWSHHHIGTTRMSLDPDNGVVDQNLKVHGVKNLYVASSSTFVTSGVANPTLTIAALSLRLSEHLYSMITGK